MTNMHVATIACIEACRYGLLVGSAPARWA